jgi:hypothetical protein
MSWTTIRGHRPTGPVFYSVRDNDRIPHQKCSCGLWYCIEHITKVAGGASRPNEPEESLF